MYRQRLQQLSDALSKARLDGFVLPVNDEFMGEYTPASARRLEWLTGFTGSAGTVALAGGKAAFFTDGRYVLQAEKQLDPALYERFNSGVMTPEAWIAQTVKPGTAIGYDPALHTQHQLVRFARSAAHVKWQPLTPNPVDAIWTDRPAPPATPVWIYPDRFSGISPHDKRRNMADELRRLKLDAMLLTAPDSICWLLDIRASDVSYTPFALCYALLDAAAHATLFIDEARLSDEVKRHLGPEVSYRKMSALQEACAALKGKSVLYDPAQSPVRVRQLLEDAGATLHEGDDPCQLPKACKNGTEIAATREAHRLDGLAVTRFLHYLSQHHAQLDENAVHARLVEERKASDLFLEPSFHTIAGSGPNGAIVHYRASEENSRKIDTDSLLLIDSGGQYLGGTTDITRTVAIGTPSDEMKTNFTRVLKGHIALALAVFPEGTTGTQLDVLARQHLWQAGLDYDHGTGHGVGVCLSVHEGPQRISKRAPGVGLRPGMIVSNEPGYYKSGAYGIRIESLVVVEAKEGFGDAGQYYCFDTLTLVPIDRNAILPPMLTQTEKDWLNAYHRRVYDAHERYLGRDARDWLAQATAAV